MRLLLILIGFAAVALSAQTVQAAVNCSNSCSTECIRGAQKLLDRCDLKSDGGDIVSTCDDVFSGDDRITCTRKATSSAAIRACADVFSGDDQLRCATGAISEEAVRACDSAVTGNDRLKCALTGKTASFIRACDDKYTGADELKCLGIKTEGVGS